AMIQERQQQDKHRQNCEAILRGMDYWRFGETTYQEREKATEKLRKALAATDIYATAKELEQVKEQALEDIEAEIDERLSESNAERKADRYLSHVDVYLRERARKDHEIRSRFQLGREIKEDLRPELVDEILDKEDMSEEEAKDFIEDWIDEFFDDEI